MQGQINGTKEGGRHKTAYQTSKIKINKSQIKKIIWLLSPIVLVSLVWFGIIITGEIRSRNIGISYSPTPTSSSQKSLSMIFVGDIMLSRSVGDLMAVKDDYLWPFRNVADYLNSADLTFANLETPISSRGVNVGSIYSFRSNPKSIQGLEYAGFDVLSLANNHAWDYGREAFVDTMDHLASAGISYVGAGHDEEEARSGVVKNVGDTKVGFLAYTNLLPKSLSAGVNSPGIAILDEAKMVEDIRNMKSRSDLVVVSFHWGEEYKVVHNSLQERIAHGAIDAGADLIIGHHPHVVQDIQEYNGKNVVYSLGNFIFDQNWSSATMKGLSVKVWLENKAISRIESLPVNISRQYQPSF